MFPAPMARVVARSGVEVTLWAAPGNRVRFTGVIREADVGAWLMPLVEEVHGVAIEHALDEVVIDLRGLEYANAALWRCFVQWVKKLRQASGPSYVLRLITDPAHAWQAVGVPALKIIGLDSNGVERLVVGEAAA